MTGNANSTPRAHTSWLARVTQMPRQYVAIDGGSGAHLLAALPEYDPFVQQVASPRYANLLIIIEPISQKLIPAVQEVAATLARPASILLVAEPDTVVPSLTEGENVHLEELFPGAERITEASPEAIVARVAELKQYVDPQRIDQPEPDTLQLPQKQEQEMATELTVLSLGPVQPFTAGPLRLLLVCDGEQVFSAQVESGYAYRGIEQAMAKADWRQRLLLARNLDPLAPLAGQLVYVQAIEQLQHWQAQPQVARLREVAVALERAQNMLWWTVRFARILDDPQFLKRAYSLAREFDEQLSLLWQQPPTTWLLPHAAVTAPITASVIARLRKIGERIEALNVDVVRNRLLALRTRTIGILSVERLKAARGSGPVLEASELSTGDVQSRLMVRLRSAALDLYQAIDAFGSTSSIPASAVQWDVPFGEAHATVAGPRGTIGLHVRNEQGDTTPSFVWQRPSAALLPLLPELLLGQKLVDAEVILASLDLSMAEADG